MQLILASSSSYRQAVLKRLGLAFTAISPDIDESAHAAEPPKALVKRLALTKAQTVAASHPDAVVIGADQIAVHGVRILGKPGNRTRAVEQLTSLSGQSVHYLSGIAVVAPGQPDQVITHQCDVQFRKLDASEIRNYVSQEEPFDCAGSLKAESLGIAMLDSLESDDPTSILGLPLICLLGLMRKVGIDPLRAESN